MDELRERAIGLLTAAATGKSAEPRANAIEALSAVPTRLEPFVRAALVDENLAVRTVGAMMVGRAKLTASAPFVVPLLRDESPMVRAAAMYALNRCGHPVDMTPLADLLQDSSPRVRAHAAFVLGEAGEASAIALLREAGKDPMPRAALPEVRLMQLQMAEARIKLGDDDALHEVRAALYPARSEDLEATALAAQIVGQVRDKASMEQLILLTAMKDDAGRLMPPEIRLAAAGSLARLGQPKGSFIAREYAASDHATQRAQSAYVFGETGQMGNLVPLATLMDDRNELVRVAAAAAVLKITDGGTGGARSARGS
jgi:HEAT repeat protein